MRLGDGIGEGESDFGSITEFCIEQPKGLFRDPDTGQWWIKGNNNFFGEMKYYKVDTQAEYDDFKNCARGCINEEKEAEFLEGLRQTQAVNYN